MYVVISGRDKILYKSRVACGSDVYGSHARQWMHCDQGKFQPVNF